MKSVPQWLHLIFSSISLPYLQYIPLSLHVFDLSPHVQKRQLWHQFLIGLIRQKCQLKKDRCEHPEAMAIWMSAISFSNWFWSRKRCGDHDMSWEQLHVLVPGCVQRLSWQRFLCKGNQHGMNMSGSHHFFWNFLFSFLGGQWDSPTLALWPPRRYWTLRRPLFSRRRMRGWLNYGWTPWIPHHLRSKKCVRWSSLTGACDLCFWSINFHQLRAVWRRNVYLRDFWRERCFICIYIYRDVYIYMFFYV